MTNIDDRTIRIQKIDAFLAGAVFTMSIVFVVVEYLWGNI